MGRPLFFITAQVARLDPTWNFFGVSWWGSTHDEIGLVSRTNAIRVAATGGRRRRVADIGVATSTAGEQRTRRTLVGGAVSRLRNGARRRPGRRISRHEARVSRPPPDHLGGSAWAEPPYVLRQSSLTNNPTNPEPTRRRKTSTDLEETGSDRATDSHTTGMTPDARQLHPSRTSSPSTTSPTTTA